MLRNVGSRGYRWRDACCRRGPVVSFSHELLVELFRNGGDLAPLLLRRCIGMVIDHDSVEHRSIDLSQVVSTEYRADAVVMLRDRAGAAVAAIIVEIQLGVDRHKERTWPVYVAALYHKLDCPVILLVVTPSPAVAAWARRPIQLGHPGFALAPLVIELREVPRTVDPVEVQKLPELGVLSAMANPDLEVVSAAMSVVSGLPEDRARLYLDVILAALPPPLRKALDMEGQLYERFKGELARIFYAQGLEVGHEEGFEEGQMRGLRSAVLALVRTKLDAVSREDEAAIEAICDENVLTELIGTLGRATSAAEVRAALTTAHTPP